MTPERATTRRRISRDDVVAAALRVMDTDGLDAVTMRRVASEVGVEAMSLYHHVRDKDDLFDGVVEHVMGGFPLPEPTGDAIEDGKELARAWRRLLKAHPAVMALLGHRHGAKLSPDALRPMEHGLRILTSLGLGSEDAMRVFQSFGGYIQGFVMNELRGMFDADAVDMPVASVSMQDFPCVAAALPYLLHCDVEEQFEYGLDLLLTGALARARTA
jgi:TetR/AcrR family transcriptional regulator, tetracycline repressor protein